ncbi:MAG: hypothetical protein ACXACU_12640 [Candidatus Hodarchaeales archaeon]
MNYEDLIKSFDLGDGQKYVLLLHGFTGAPYEVYGVVLKYG